MSNPQSPNAESRGLLYGFIGVACFSLTLPATRTAVAELDPTFVGLGRALVASVPAGLLLLATRQPRPARRYWASLLVVVAGVIVGFPLLSALALGRLPAAHGAIVTGLLPLASAIAGALRAGDRPSRAFWFASLLGSGVVVVFAFLSGGGAPQVADLLLLAAVAAAGMGYAEGARLARVLGAWQVICWALVIAVPLLVVPVALAAWLHGLAASPPAWLGFAYVSIISQFLAFFAWYHGLAIGGVARVGQLQLFQPFMTIAASALLLGEPITQLTLVAAVLVFAAVAAGARSQISREVPAPPGAGTAVRST
jgi:drug/metabolite transporter (DMT)-like permease